MESAWVELVESCAKRVNEAEPAQGGSSNPLASASLPTPSPTVEDSPPQPSPPPLPSWLDHPPLSDEENSSCDEDEYGEPKPARPVAFDSAGRPRPRPAYYYDADYEQGGHPTKRHRRGGEKGIPVFEPTMDEFAREGGFYGYIQRIEKYGLRSGIVKVIPPAEWTGTLPSTAVPLEAVRLKEPIEQHIHGSQGLYRVTNVAKTRIWNPAQWKLAADSNKYAPPDFVADREMPDRSERSSERNGIRRNPRKSAVEKPTIVEEPAPVEKVVVEEAIVEEQPVVEENPVREPLEEDMYEYLNCSPVASTSTLPPLSELSDESSFTPVAKAKRRRPTNNERAEPTREEWHSFIDNFEDLPHSTKREDYTIEMMREIERKYWRTLTFGEPPMYGADMAGSLFDRSTSAWNVADLGDLLPRLAPESCRIPGVVSPYLYFGMWRATFAWHVEDADLYSINYIHFGAPKFWYSVPQENSAKFERVMAGFFPNDVANCSQFLRHKQFLASPRALAHEGIHLNRIVQLPGEFILTYPKGYHSGFNLGFNCAESVNFATERWIPLGRTAKACVCIGDSVNINVDAWLAEAAAAEYGRPYAYNGNDSAPRRKRMAPPVRSIYSEHSLDHNGEPARKRKKVVKTAPELLMAEPSKRVKKDVSNVKTIAKDDYVCLLCPDMSTEGLVQVADSLNPREKDNFAHRLCAMFTPETYMDGEVVRGFRGIPRARWALKCAICLNPHGTKIQCTTGKCLAAFHATCAIQEESGIHLDAIVVENGVSISLYDELKNAPLAPVIADGVAEADVPMQVDSTAAVGGELEAGASIEGATPVAEATAAVAGEAPIAGSSREGVEQAVGVAPQVEDVTMNPAIPATKPSKKGRKPKKKPKVVQDAPMSFVVLCKAHNPDYKQVTVARKAAEIEARVLTIPIGSDLRVRTGQGVFEVTLLEVVLESKSIKCTFEDGTPIEVKWKAINFSDASTRRVKDQNSAPGVQQILIYEATPKDAPSTADSALPTSAAAAVGSVQVPLPYSNYCPTALYAPPSPTHLPVNAHPDVPESSCRSPSPIRATSTKPDPAFPPFQPHVFSFGGLTHSPPTAPTSLKSTSLPPLPPYDRPNARHPIKAILEHPIDPGQSFDDYRERRKTISIAANQAPPSARPHPENRRSSLPAPSFQNYRMDGPSSPSGYSFPSQHPKDSRTLPSIASLLHDSEPVDPRAVPTFFDNPPPMVEPDAAALLLSFGSPRDSLSGGKKMGE